MHFLVLRGINRTPLNTKLLLAAVLTLPLDCISSCHTLKAQHYYLSPNGCFSPALVPHPSPPSLHPLPPTPYRFNLEYIGTKKTLKTQQHSSTVACRISYKMITTHITILLINITGVTVLYHKRSIV